MAAQLRRGPRRPPPARGLLRGARARGCRGGPRCPPWAANAASAASSPPRWRRRGRGGRATAEGSRLACWRGCLPLPAGLSVRCAGRRGRRLSPPCLLLCRGEEEAPLSRPALHVRHFQPASAAGASGGRGRAVRRAGPGRGRPRRRSRGVQKCRRAVRYPLGRGRAASWGAPPRWRADGRRDPAAQRSLHGRLRRRPTPPGTAGYSAGDVSPIWAARDTPPSPGGRWVANLRVPSFLFPMASCPAACGMSVRAHRR